MYENELYHHGIQGMHWYVRRYQNKDGSLTAAGRKRYGVGKETTAKQYQNRLNDMDKRLDSDRKQIQESTLTKNAIKGWAKTKGKYEEYDDGGYGIKFNHTRRDQKIANRFIAADEKQKKAEQSYHNGQKEVNKIIKELKKNGYDVNSKEVTRLAMNGKDYAELFIGTVAGTTVAVALASTLSPAATAGAIKGGVIGAASGTAKALERSKVKGMSYKVNNKNN